MMDIIGRAFAWVLFFEYTEQYEQYRIPAVSHSADLKEYFRALTSWKLLYPLLFATFEGI